MTRRRFLLGGVVLVLLLASRSAAQYPNIPPTRVPQTAEPGLADPSNLPKRLPADMERLGAQPPFGNQPRLGSPAPIRPAGVEELQPASNDPPVPAVAIRVRAPAHVAAGAPVEYTITVENSSQAAAHHVTITNPIPANARYDGGAEPPPAETTDTLLRWKFGTLAPGVSKEIKLKLVPKDDGEFVNVARVTFEHGQRVTTIIDKPRVALKREAPQYAHEKDRIPIKLVIENMGRAPVTNLIVEDVLSDGLVHENGKQNYTQTIENLRPGEKRELKYTVTATRQGTFSLTATAKEDRFKTDQQTTWTLMVGKPVLDAKISGPLKTYLTQSAEYTVTVKNDGNVPLDNVTVAVTLPPAFKVVRASQEAQSFKDRVQWGISRFEPKGTRTFKIALQTMDPGKAQVIASVLARGAAAQSSVETDFQGATALRLRVRESSNRVMEGDKITYTVTVTNTGTIEAKDVHVEFDLPKIELVKLDASSEAALRKPDQKLVWGPLVVKPGKTTSMTVTATAVRAGVMLFQAALDGPKEEFKAGPITQQVQTVIEPK